MPELVILETSFVVALEQTRNLAHTWIAARRARSGDLGGVDVVRI